MQEFTSREEQKLLEILRQFQKKLFAFKGVHYLDIGYRFTKGRPLPQLAIRAHVFKKKPLAALDPSETLPRFIAGIPVDVIQSNPRPDRLLNFRNIRFDPLLGGIAVRNPKYNALGTLGAIVRAKDSNAAMALSNHHVLVGDTGKSGDIITQPATAQLTDVIGTLAKWNEPLDCAVCDLNSSRALSPAILEIATIPAKVEEPRIGMFLTKSGFTTGVTYGIIDGISFDEFTIIPAPEYHGSAGEISAPGDSGAIWLRTESATGVGLHYAGEKDPRPEAERAWAKKLSKVFEALKIEFFVSAKPI